ncbi:MAG: hypothetical protein RBT72_02135 [Spirochaetia bacterium]|nr:hypothetical protein [Spirochaetales bacterium]MDX9783534.1 hypothetical protein [Spirochaetia bacterium]
MEKLSGAYKYAVVLIPQPAKGIANKRVIKAFLQIELAPFPLNPLHSYYKKSGIEDCRFRFRRFR